MQYNWQRLVLRETLRAPLRLANKCGHIVFSLPTNTRSLLCSGKVVVFSNHPSFIETFVLWHVLDSLTRRNIWSIADERLLPDRWLEALQCITVSRDSSPQHRERVHATNLNAQQKVDDVLLHNDLVIFYPEGTRTCNARTHCCLNDRIVGRCRTGLLRRAQVNGASLVPVYVEHGECETPQGYGQGYVKLLRGETMRLTFGEPYTGPITPDGVAHALLTCGQ